MASKTDRRPPTRTDAGQRSSIQRAILAAAVGNFVEWFSYGIYGYLAATLALVFFPQDGTSTGLLATFAVFGIAFIVIPLGGVFFGALGDRIGRKRVLAIVILLMASSTFLIGVLPPYAVVGVLSPVLLTLMRLVAGFSAGGEPAGAASFLLEYAKPGRRGLTVCFWHFSSFLGNAMAGLFIVVLTTMLSEPTMQSWGWRIPFLICGPLGAIGLYIRSRMEDTPEFADLEAKGQVASSPVRETIAANKKQILQTAGAVVLQGVVFYLILVYLQTYLTVVGHSTAFASFSTIAANLSAMLVIIPFGALSDRIGRRNQMVAAAAGLVVLGYPLFVLLNSPNLVWVTVAHCALAILLALFMGASAAGLPELFPTRVRYTGFAIGFTIPLALFGGNGPAAATYLISATGSTLAPAFIVIASALVGGIAVTTIRAKSGHN
ncbi:MFS transporter [Saccharopolyspora sp. ASAGF58]|uniref:MFS transporter n=1 Tax=Saccharopolyspora sp. ASAGF58 TaxID=2719023 RepID=UPI00144605E6|nr:MFS transporter [Saccharopolyspora sp. ASAGF58]